MATSMNVTSSVLNASGRYFSSVTAVNSLGRMVTSVSDGFVYDPTPPTTGLLYVTQQNGSLDLRWEGFHDTESTLDHYEYAVSESGTQPSNSAFVDVGLRLSVGVTSPLAHGTQYTIHLRAVNRAGLPSEAAVAMVTGDSTPPIGINCSFDINLIVNPSFEGQASCAEQGGSLSSWEVEPGVVLVPVGDVVPADGCYSARVVGSLSQSIPTSPNTTYRLSFFTRARRNESLLAVDGTVEAEGVRQWVFAVQDTWSAVLLEFTAASEVTNITFKTNDDYSDGYLIDDVTVSSCQEMSRLDDVSDRVTWPEVFDVKQSHASSPSPALYVCWSIDDEESGLADWAFSVGTSPGGGQLLPFASTLERCAELQELDLPHGIEVFVGVKVTNRAGLTRLIHSNGYRIDLTPPTFVSGVQDGPGPVDIDYQQGSVLQAWWTAADEESNVVRCYASMGSAPGAADVRSLTDVGQAGNVTWTASLDVGRTVYTTVVCVNGAGLAATATSDGVTIATTPVISEAELLLESNSQDTLYRSTEGYFPSSDITARWRGFTDSTNSPLHYEFSLHDTSPAPWVGVGPLQQLVLYALPVPPGEGHTLEVRALNLADLTTAQLGGDVNVSAEEPSLTGEAVLACRGRDSGVCRRYECAPNLLPPTSLLGPHCYIIYGLTHYHMLTSPPPSLLTALLPSPPPSLLTALLPSPPHSLLTALLPSPPHSLLTALLPSPPPSLLTALLPSPPPSLLTALLPSPPPSLLTALLPSPPHSLLTALLPSPPHSLLTALLPSPPPSLLTALLPSPPPSLLTALLPSPPHSLLTALLTSPPHSLLTALLPSPPHSLLTALLPSPPPSLLTALLPSPPPLLRTALLPSLPPSPHSLLTALLPSPPPLLLTALLPSLPPSLLTALLPSPPPLLHTALLPSLPPSPHSSLHFSLHPLPPLPPLPFPPLPVGIPINSTWVTSTQLLIVDWEGTFASSLPLHYEVSVGTSLGSGSVLSWMETELTSLAYQHPRLVSTEDYFVTVTAIAANGHSTTAWTMVHAVF